MPNPRPRPGNPGLNVLSLPVCQVTQEIDHGGYAHDIAPTSDRRALPVEPPDFGKTRYAHQPIHRPLWVGRDGQKLLAKGQV